MFSIFNDMEFEDILQKVITLAGEQFKVQEITGSSTAADIAAWNSLSHVMLIASIENEYGIKFDILKMIDMQSIGDIAQATHEIAQHK